MLEQAHALLDEVGPEAVTLRETARRAGVSATATYRHFRDKEGLLAAVATEGFDQFAERLAASVQGGRPFDEMTRAYVLFALERPGLFRLMFSPLFMSRAAHPDMATAAAKTFAVLNAAASVANSQAGRSPVSAWAEAHGLAHLLLDGMVPLQSREEILNGMFGPPKT